MELYSTKVHLIQSFKAHIRADLFHAIIISFSAAIDMGVHNLEVSIDEKVNILVFLFIVGSSNFAKLVRYIILNQA
ncbi:MAG: hypothetical protein WCG25_06495 [bacterium]